MAAKIAILLGIIGIVITIINPVTFEPLIRKISDQFPDLSYSGSLLTTGYSFQIYNKGDSTMEEVRLKANLNTPLKERPIVKVDERLLSHVSLLPSDSTLIEQYNLSHGTFSTLPFNLAPGQKLYVSYELLNPIRVMEPDIIVPEVFLTMKNRPAVSLRKIIQRKSLLETILTFIGTLPVPARVFGISLFFAFWVYVVISLVAVWRFSGYKTDARIFSQALRVIFRSKSKTVK